MRVAWLFPGQGSQAVGMGLALWEAFPAARAVFAQADAGLGYPLTELMFRGDEARLTQTEHAQPAIFVSSLATLAALQASAGDRLPAPSFVAGHSLGEYTAVVAAGGLTTEAGIGLVRERARAMQRAADLRPGAMAAILAQPVADTEAACAAALAAHPDEVVVIANENADGQTVISGTVAGVETAMAEAKARGARRAMRLTVGGAFHSPLMTPARAELAAAVQAAPVHDLRVPLVANLSATPIVDAGAVRDELVAQIDSRVRWDAGIAAMLDAGVDTFVEVGAGPITAWLKRRGGCRAIALDGPTAIAAFAADLT